jgi:hypothetical protein
MPRAQARKRHMQFSREGTGQRAEKRGNRYIFRYSAVSVGSLIGCKLLKNLEARVGIEPTHKGFADLSLTTWVPRLGWATFRPFDFEEKCTAGRSYLERETGVEPATSSLARKHSTTELLPLLQV